MVYATFDHQPVEIGPDDMLNPMLETSGVGNNRRLSPILGFPAMTVPAGFTSDGLPVGLEFLARPYAESTLFRFGYAYEQATHHRKPPALTTGVRGDRER
jgi:Asp-tRNA(Asn)/Glu-tRNA(Gln) amidotransferase A subunit family amidase